MCHQIVERGMENGKDVMIEELSLSKERGLEMKLQHPLFALLAEELVKMFDKASAVNYVEYTVFTAKYGQMQVCIQRLEGETPAMQNKRLREKIAELEAQMKGGVK